ncbi:MAG: tetratricopeptide repeat protein [Thermoanaerobaculaceae bacterium]
MGYPGSPDKEPKVQQRILAAFREAVRLYQDGHRDECQTVLHSILEVDPLFRPAQHLERAIIQGLPVDLGQLFGETVEETAKKTEELLAQARQALAEGQTPRAVALAQEVLREFPGHKEARGILQQAEAFAKAESEVATQLARARDALSAGLVDEAQGFLKIVRQLNPQHPELAELESQLAFQVGQTPEVEFSTFTPPPGLVSAEAAGALDVSSSREAEAGFEAPWEAAAKQGGAGFSFDSGAVAPSFGDLSEAQRGAENRVQELLAEGQEAFDRGDYNAAVDTWSRIYLIDAHNQEADRRIEQARRRLDELNRLAEMKFADARDAFERGEVEQARALLQEVLSLQPQHVDANDLLARLETPAAPPPLPSDVPVVEEDLFRDDFVPANIASGDATAAMPMEAVEEVPRVRIQPQPSARKGLPLPLPVLAGAGLAVVVLVSVALLFGGKVFQRGPSLDDTLAEAERLAQQGQLKDALNLLQALNLDGPEANQVQQRILEYQKKLKAQKPAQPAIDLTPITQALGEGRRFQAARLLLAESKKAPLGEELRPLMAQITAYEPGLPTLSEAWERQNWERAAHLLQEMVQAHPQDQELRQASQIARYNYGLKLLRNFSVAEATRVFEQLYQETNDPEIGRLLDMTRSYLSRSVDPRYTIFVNSLRLRDLQP